MAEPRSTPRAGFARYPRRGRLDCWVGRVLASAGLKPAAIAGYNMCARLFARPIAWAYGRMFTRDSRPSPYLPLSLAQNYFDDALTIEVDPRRVSHRVPYSFRETQRSFGLRFVWQGEWDVEAELLDDDPRFIDMSELASNHIYRTTRAYRRMSAAAEDGHPESRQRIALNSTDAIDEYFEDKVRLLHSLRSMGYKSQAQLGQSGDEIGIAVGRNGELIKYFHGHHRVALSKVLGLDSITVTVGMVHHMWIQKCCTAYGGDPVEAIRKGLARLVVNTADSA